MKAVTETDPLRWHRDPAVEAEVRDAVAEAREEGPPAAALTRMEDRLRTSLDATTRRPGSDAWRIPTRLAWAAAVLLVAGSAWWMQRPDADRYANDSAAPLRVVLNTGDTLILAAGAELEVLESEPSLRRARVRDGSALFDVAPLGPSEAFEVEAGDVRFRVLGTVFTVEVHAGRVVLRVYEGRVRVDDGSVVRGGETWDSAGEIRVAPLAEAPLHPQALQASRARHRGRPNAPAPPPPLVRATIEALQVTTLEDAARVHAPPHVEPRQSVPRGMLDGQANDEETPEAQQEAALAGQAQQREALAEIHELIGRGRFSDALEQLMPLLEQAPGDGLALWLKADALRALGRDREAAQAYEAAAEGLRGQARARAGYRAAELRLHALSDPAGCLALLERVRAHAAPSRVRELALVLRVEALLAAGRDVEAAHAAERYLALEPNGDAVPYILRLLGW